MNRIKICIADDHKLVSESMVSLMGTMERITSAYSVDNGLKLLASIPEKKPDLVLLDLQMPELNGVDTAELLVREHPQVKILVLTMSHDSNTLVRLLKIGIHGYITKNISMDNLEKAIYQVMDEGYYFDHETAKMLADYIRAENVLRPKRLNDQIRITQLTEREIGIVKLICIEQDNETIANGLGISVKTLQAHKQNIYKKTETNGPIALFRYAYKAGMVEM